MHVRTHYWKERFNPSLQAFRAGKGHRDNVTELSVKHEQCYPQTGIVAQGHQVPKEKSQNKDHVFQMLRDSNIPCVLMAGWWLSQVL